MRSTVLQNILGFMGAKQSNEKPPLTVTFVPPPFKPWFDERIGQEIKTASEDEAIKRVHAMNPQEVLAFADEHKHNFQMGHYRNNAHEAIVIAKSVQYCIFHYRTSGAYAPSALLSLWDIATDLMLGNKIAKALDKIEKL